VNIIQTLWHTLLTSTTGPDRGSMRSFWPHNRSLSSTRAGKTAVQAYANVPRRFKVKDSHLRPGGEFL
jgi:hypothetical protein